MRIYEMHQDLWRFWVINSLIPWRHHRIIRSSIFWLNFEVSSSHLHCKHSSDESSACTLVGVLGHDCGRQWVITADTEPKPESAVEKTQRSYVVCLADFLEVLVTLLLRYKSASKENRQQQEKVQHQQLIRNFSPEKAKGAHDSFCWMTEGKAGSNGRDDH